ncbi:MAG: molybdenum cofactor biosynthesis protein MoaE [Archaeoglobales archaeon]|nr:MAG: molybdenum cofactor biosynthesis protein MoaE [Archaeoglobales archaeon]
MIRIQREDFSVEEFVDLMRGRDVGAIVTFLGVVRGFSRGRNVFELEYEVYHEMALKTLEEIRKEAIERFNIKDVFIIHRFGRLKVGERIVLIVVGASHRKEAFEACSFCIDEIKRRVPIWKKEKTDVGEYWV